ncbi:WD-repeats-region domain-containing protein [Favolaschia claudopus]|uniref:WD-repeats-region domain-containing protein n=1 Tax=Favolaschia claudopus TaxID=2862362 RepID=A0AAW0EDC3_9AGAR
MTAPRIRQRQDVEEAYTVQTRSAIEGALHGGSIGLGLSIIGHYTWPFFRRQTFQFKGFLVCTCTVFGLVIGAEQALQQYEALRRFEEDQVRKEARLYLNQRGIIPTETAIAAWRAENRK